MLEDLYFRRKNVIDVDAAVVGVSRLRWASLSPEDACDPERARQVMEEMQFDVLAVDSPDKPVRQYFKTTTWGDYSAVERHDIGFDDVMPQHTSLEDVIQAFATENRNHYFLTNEHRITGLITVVNLNCREARVFLFSLLSELEVRMGRLIQHEIDQSRLSFEDVLIEAKDEVRTEYEKDKKENVERNVVEYLYLTDLIKVVRNRDLQGAIGYESKRKFEGPFGKLVTRRNDVAHPVRSLVDGPDSAAKLWRDLVTIKRALFQLRNWEAATLPSAGSD